MSEKPIPDFKDLTPLGKNLEKSLYRRQLMEKLLDELKGLASTKGLKGSDGTYIHLPVQKLLKIYFPWREEFYLGYISTVKERGAEENMDADIEVKLYAARHDTRKKPAPVSDVAVDDRHERGVLEPQRAEEEAAPFLFNLDTYLKLEEEGRLEYSIWLNKVLSHGDVFNPEDRLRYKILKEEKVGALKWWK